MPSFDDHVPPNMDRVCETVVGASSTVETCSVPLDYYKAYMMDIVVIAVVAFIVYKVLR